MIFDLSRIVNEGFTIPETVFTKIYFCVKWVWSSDSS